MRAPHLWWGLTLVACATAGAPEKPAASTWRPDPGPEMLKACAGDAAASCRATAEKLASSGVDADSCGALRAFSAACTAGDAPACTALETRFRSSRLRAGSGGPPLASPPRGRFRALCLYTRDGPVRDCTVLESFQGDGGTTLQWLTTSARFDPPTLDGRPFECVLPFTIDVEVRTTVDVRR